MTTSRGSREPATTPGTPRVFLLHDGRRAVVPIEILAMELGLSVPETWAAMDELIAIGAVEVES